MPAAPSTPSGLSQRRFRYLIDHMSIEKRSGSNRQAGECSPHPPLSRRAIVLSEKIARFKHKMNSMPGYFYYRNLTGLYLSRPDTTSTQKGI